METIAAYATEMRDFLAESELTERRAFIESFVKEIVVTPDDALMRYTIPISQSTPKTLLLLGGRSEEFRVGNEAEASSQLVWGVDGRLHPEEQPHVELWPSQQFVFPVDVFLQSLSSTPTVRPRQHVAIGLGNPVRELAVPAQVSAYGQVPHRRAAETPPIELEPINNLSRYSRGVAKLNLGEYDFSSAHGQRRDSRPECQVR